MTEHTPGPWEFLEAGRSEEEFNIGRPLTIGEVNAPHNDIANVYSASDATVSITRDQAMANATLIAAAPDLLCALRFVLAFYEPGQRYLDTNAWKQAEAAARRAVAKAEGKS